MTSKMVGKNWLQKTATDIVIDQKGAQGFEVVAFWFGLLTLRYFG